MRGLPPNPLLTQFRKLQPSPLEVGDHLIVTSVHGFPRQPGHFFSGMSNRVEHQKLNQEAAELPPGWVFGVQLGLRQTQALIKTKTIRRGKLPPAILQLSSSLLLNSNIAGGNFPLFIVWVFISAFVCRWLSFWCPTRLLMPEKKWPA